MEDDDSGPPTPTRLLTGAQMLALTDLDRLNYIADTLKQFREIIGKHTNYTEASHKNVQAAVLYVQQSEKHLTARIEDASKLADVMTKQLREHRGTVKSMVDTINNNQTTLKGEVAALSRTVEEMRAIVLPMMNLPQDVDRATRTLQEAAASVVQMGNIVSLLQTSVKTLDNSIGVLAGELEKDRIKWKELAAEVESTRAKTAELEDDVEDITGQRTETEREYLADLKRRASIPEEAMRRALDSAASLAAEKGKTEVALHQDRVSAKKELRGLILRCAGYLLLVVIGAIGTGAAAAARGCSPTDRVPAPTAHPSAASP